MFYNHLARLLTKQLRSEIIENRELLGRVDRVALLSSPECSSLREQIGHAERVFNDLARNNAVLDQPIQNANQDVLNSYAFALNPSDERQKIFGLCHVGPLLKRWASLLRIALGV